jgi:predicted GNAT family N-acyltransferase
MPLITTVSKSEEVQGILDLQQQNLREKLDSETIANQGFVTVKHDYPTLKAMNDAEPSIIAKDNDKIVGYCLSMLPQFREAIPTLESLFQLIDEVEYEEKKLKQYSYVVMGQVCVAEEFRGQQIFDKMYYHMQEVLSDRYELCITDISSANARSLRAHTRVGFKSVHEFYEPSLQEVWHLVVWDWRQV